MTCTSLIAQQRQPLYFPLLDIANGSVSKDGKKKEMTGPGVRGLQAWIEDAWHQGYDPEGANDKSMKWHLLGTKKYIGTSGQSLCVDGSDGTLTAVLTLQIFTWRLQHAGSRSYLPSSARGHSRFNYLPFISPPYRCSLIDFPRPPKNSTSRTSSSTPTKSKSSPNSPSTGTPETSATALVKWIVNCFDNTPQPGMPDGLSGSGSGGGGAGAGVVGQLKNSGVIVSDRMPIILQVSLTFYTTPG